MGFFRPQEVLDIIQEEADPNWSPRDLAKLNQEDLFMTRENKLLEKIPYNWNTDRNARRRSVAAIRRPLLTGRSRRSISRLSREKVSPIPQKSMR